MGRTGSAYHLFMTSLLLRLLDLPERCDAWLFLYGLTACAGGARTPATALIMPNESGSRVKRVGSMY